MPASINIRSNVPMLAPLWKIVVYRTGRKAVTSFPFEDISIPEPWNARVIVARSRSPPFLKTDDKIDNTGTNCRFCACAWPTKRETHSVWKRTRTDVLNCCFYSGEGIVNSLANKLCKTITFRHFTHFCGTIYIKNAIKLPNSVIRKMTRKHKMKTNRSNLYSSACK